MEIRDVVDSDWAAIWGFMEQILAAGDTCCWPTDTSEAAARTWWMGKTRRSGGYAAMQFNAVVETNEPAVRLWESLGFTVLATVPEAFRHPDRGLVGLHIMHRFLR